MIERIAKLSWVLALPIPILIPLTAYAQTRPPLPYEDPGACPFECCTYREWVTNKLTAIHKNRSNNSPVVFTVAPREWVEGLTGVVVTTSPGQIRIVRPITIQYWERSNTSKKIQARPGDVVYFLTYQGEGSFKAWFKGKLLTSVNVTELMEQNQRGSAGGGSNLPKPKSTWWVKIKNRQGQTGWTDQAGNFDNKDACGAPVQR